MDSSTCNYHFTEDVDPTFIHDMYCGPNAEEKLLCDIIEFPIRAILNCYKQGLIKGDTMIDFSYAGNIFQILAIYKCFKDIIILEAYDSCMTDTENWLQGGEIALDWSHAARIMEELQGTSADWKEMENDLKSRVRHFSKCILENENPTDPIVLPKADCLVNLYLLGTISKDLDHYSRNVKKLSSMLNKGACMIIIGAFNSSYYIMNGKKHHSLGFTETDLRKVLSDNDLRVGHMEVCERTSCIKTATFDHIFVVCAEKESCD
uniref:Uncharacterized protein n=1 Tax=Leptobrachium leishanense TaxID=445787 RepID=A0A8C5PDR9_9ANUR